MKMSNFNTNLSFLLLGTMAIIGTSTTASSSISNDDQNKPKWDDSRFVRDYSYNVYNDISAEEISHYEQLRAQDIERIKQINKENRFYTKLNIDSLMNKRIRREVRDIEYTEWLKIADAMNVMKFTNQDEGIAKYGDKFKNWDFMTCYHAQAAWQEIGNTNHFAPSFITWHRAFEMMFEESILAIDPSIEAVPYWDFRRDILNPLHSVLFTDKYFGELMGDTDHGYAIKDGPFAYWPIGDASKSGPDCTKVSNIWGQMRNPVHREKSEYVTRIGGAFCGKTNNFVGTLDEWDECLLLDNIEDFNACWENTFHYAAHAFVGGTRRINGSVIESTEHFDFFSETDDFCYTWSASDEVTSIDGKSRIYKFYAHPVNDCFDCHKKCDITDESYQCQSCHLINEECTIVEGKTDGDHSDAQSYSFRLNTEDVEYIWGDFLDAIASPNEPFFMFHHINLDRYTYIFELMNYELQPYYGYPADGWATGINLADVACFEHPLRNIFEMYEKDKALTHRDILLATTFEDSPFMYDDILEGILASIKEMEEEEQEALQLAAEADAAGAANGIEKEMAVNSEQVSNYLFGGLLDVNQIAYLFVTIAMMAVIVVCVLDYKKQKLRNSIDEVNSDVDSMDGNDNHSDNIKPNDSSTNLYGIGCCRNYNNGTIGAADYGSV